MIVHPPTCSHCQHSPIILTYITPDMEWVRYFCTIECFFEWAHNQKGTSPLFKEIKTEVREYFDEDNL